MGVGGGLIFAWWVWAMVAIVCVLLAICAVLKLHEANIYLLREVSKVIRRPWFETVLLLFLIGGLVQYGATKGTNGTSGVSGNLLPSGPMGTPFLTSWADDLQRVMDKLSIEHSAPRMNLMYFDFSNYERLCDE